MKYRQFLVSFCLLSLLMLSSSYVLMDQPYQEDPPSFEDYWLKGNGEVNSYSLKQIRYGEVHEGEAVLTFSAEDFSRSKQVRLDFPEKAGSDAVKVLKVNQIRKFSTGIYDYSILQSAFTPIDLEKYPNSMKVTTSIQDWNGHVYSQLNLRPYQFILQLLSYFESEGDQEFQLEKALLEDEIWNLIRIDPKALPEGNIQIIPSMITARLRHYALGVEDARAKLDSGKKTSTYEIDFIDSDRKLKITFQTEFPHVIEGWEEEYKEAGKKLTTTATLKKTMQIEYWHRHFNSDRKLREELELSK